MDRKKALSLFVGVLLSLFFLHLLLKEIPWTGVQDAFAQIHWLWAIPATLAYLLGHILRGVRCAWIIRPYKKISVVDATQIVWIGYAANNLLPARLGEVVRSFVMSKREGLPQGITLSTLFVERLLDGLSIVGILWVVALFAPAFTWIQKISWISGGIFLGALSVMLLARFWRSLFERLLAFGTGLLPTAIGEKIEGFGHRLLDGLTCLRWDLHLGGILSMSLLIWLVEGAMFLLLLPAFGIPLSPVTAYLAMSITNLGVLLPSTPGHVGTFHFFCSKALLATTITTAAIGVSYATIIHALQFIPVTLLGGISLYTYGFNLSAIWSLGNDKKDEPDNDDKTPLPPPPSNRLLRISEKLP